MGMLGEVIEVTITGDIVEWRYASNFGSGVNPMEIVPIPAFELAYRQFC